MAARRVPFALLLAPLLAGCLSSAGALPPVRWFDPLPATAAAAAEPAAVRVAAPPHLGHEFVVRVGEHEVAIDAQNQWVAEPRDLVAAVLARAFAGAKGPIDVALERFELDAAAEPRAHVRLVFGRERPAGTPPFVDVAVPAADRSPPAFAAAMAAVLATVAARVRGG